MSRTDERIAGYKLIEAGTLVNFDILDTKVEETGGGVVVDIELALGEIEDDDDVGGEPVRSEDHEWGGLGFMFCLAVLSFADARPRGVSDIDFAEYDQLTVADFLDGLKYVRGELRYNGDYVRGRCVKTNITLRPDGTATLATRLRGEAATRWVQRLKGKKVLELVQ